MAFRVVAVSMIQSMYPIDPPKNCTRQMTELDPVVSPVAGTFARNLTTASDPMPGVPVTAYGGRFPSMKPLFRVGTGSELWKPENWASWVRKVKVIADPPSADASCCDPATSSIGQ